MRGLVGTGGLVRLILRRDRYLLPLWVIVLAVVPMGFVGATDSLYPEAADRLEYARTTGTNPTFLALYGPLYDTSLGAIIAQRSGFIPVVIAIISALTVVRHTRTEEEAGRRELLGATVTGRGAGLAAALLVTTAANLVLAALLTAGLTAQGLPLAGSLALGLQLASAGCLFAAVAGVAAQLGEGAGAARGIAIAAVGVAFAVRMAADVGGAGNALSWLGWLSPFGWTNRVRAFGDERWWTLALVVALVAVLVSAAGALSARRDVGAGILPPRLGSPAAPEWLSGTFGLGWRLQSRPLYGWLAGFAALGVVYGALGNGVEDMVADNPELKEIFTKMGAERSSSIEGGGRGLEDGGQSAIIDAYFASVMSTVGLIVAAYAVSAALRLRTEEAAQRAEPLLATATGRLRWASSHGVFAALGSAAALAVTGAAAGLTHGLNSGDVGGELPRVFGAAMAQLPAVWLVGAIALALFGLAPRFTAGGAWAAVGLFALITMFGPSLDMSSWALDVSPFTHVPKIGQDFAVLPLLWLAAIAAALTALGMAGFRRRDLSAH
ncbi:ABC-2 type transport system permease protein [Actinomadura pelletieri DSM 43383]|uniref:ABC-2 type transport system permease protein n=1 Tax=Actinomadura pelletieri DSM 43383 TaxID=1120940 RepID=A0A495QIN1_9ACTN|nr:ABC transporter permease [Actinomadura pelletieri]RKS71896.1 ABC-2 type transport system permease protein [Actinomadura pelletieri DSM 43383]